MKTTTRITQSIMAIAASLLLVATAHPTVTADSGPTAPKSQESTSAATVGLAKAGGTSLLLLGFPCPVPGMGTDGTHWTRMESASSFTGYVCSCPDGTGRSKLRTPLR